ncbi:hypothetical protein KDX31_00885 [Amphritea atlantica]|uniref:Conjugal transfer pilus assembly protein TraE n=1 Tax=Amphritea atlantica TaxID=355243 RepID=A0ABY5GV37_9GAMM|nr:hypothetical protein KDX31_00885 [Amphritea atlantica]
MMKKNSNVLLGIILVLVLLNLGLTGLVLVKQVAAPALAMNDRTDSFAPSVAKAWGKKVTMLYNRQDHQGLYGLFNEQAKQKISYQQLQTQLKNLYQLFGEIEKTTFVSADKIGEKGDESYYRLLFNINVNEASKRSPRLTIVVIKRGAEMSVYGVRINADYDLE